jgi:malate dehydrogenase (oxaloacetate-decarboxylating)
VIEHDEVFRLRTRRTPGTLARVLTVIGEHRAHIGEIETVAITREYNIRDVTVIAPDDAAVGAIRSAIAALPDVEIVDETIDKVLAVHEGGKIRIEPTVDVRNLLDVREVYTPGVARVSMAIRDDPSLTDRYTWRARTVAIVTDGTRVLGLGDVGPEAALPVMEGKSLFYSKLVGINAVPIVLATKDPDEIVETVIHISPGFGGIHLEDIATPGVYDIERRLIEALPIPVFHDDQHGTAVVVLAAVLSAVRLLGRDLGDLTFGQVGLGAAGSATARIALSFPFDRVLAYDPSPDAVARLETITADHGSRCMASSARDGLDRVLAESDVLVLGTGRGGLIDRTQVRKGQVVIALSNPEPEITIDEALAGGAAIASDGSTVNNVLGFPGLFRGALDAGADRITLAMKHAAAEALSGFAQADHLLPDVLDTSVHLGVAERVREAWEKRTE